MSTLTIPVVGVIGNNILHVAICNVFHFILAAHNIRLLLNNTYRKTPSTETLAAHKQPWSPKSILVEHHGP